MTRQAGQRGSSRHKATPPPPFAMEEQTHAVPHLGPHRCTGQLSRARRHELRQHRTHHAGRGHRPRRRRPGGRDQPHRHRRHVRRRRVRGDGRQGRRRPARRHRAGHEGGHADGRRAQPPGQLAPLADHRTGQQPAPARRRPRRSLPDPPLGPEHRRRGDPVRPDRPATRRKDPLLRLVDLPGPPHRAGPVGRPRAPSEPLRHRAAQLLDPATRHRDPRPARDRGVRARCAGVEPAGLGLAVGRGPPGQARHHQPFDVHAATVRHRRTVQPGQARRRRTARRHSRRGGPDHDPARARVRDRASGGDQRAHRPPHAGPPARTARRRGHRALRRRAGRDRRRRRPGYRPGPAREVRHAPALLDPSLRRH